MAGGGEEVATAAAAASSRGQQGQEQGAGKVAWKEDVAAVVDMLLEQEEAATAEDEAAEAPEGGGGAAVERIALAYEPTYQRFRAKEKSFTQQYSHMYTHRLQALRPVLEQAAKAKWGEEGAASEGAGAGRRLHYCPRIIDLVQEEEAETEEATKAVVLVGTLFKDMPLRPSVLDEYRGDAMIQGPLAPAAGAGVNYTSADDFLVLEDDSGRVVLTTITSSSVDEEEGEDKKEAAAALSSSVLQVGEYVTGLVVAVLGRPTTGGAFLVQDICLPGLPPQPTLVAVKGGDSGPRYVLLASGLNLSSSEADGASLLPLHLLLDYVRGNLGDVDTVARLSRVVLAGGLLAPFDPHIFKEKHLSAQQQRAFSEPFRRLDLLLAQLAAACPLDVMPGSDDPANYTLPQQPLHPCLFPHTAPYKSTFRLVPNPYEFKLGGDRLLLGGSGQVPEDMSKYTDLSKALEGDSPAAAPLRLLESTLQWRHVAPTAPDTLPCYPFCDTDPFVLEECPHVYFVGNQEGFATSMMTGPNGQRCRLVCVPAFHKTQQVVLLELNSLQATPLRFSAAALSSSSAVTVDAPVKEGAGMEEDN